MQFKKKFKIYTKNTPFSYTLKNSFITPKILAKNIVLHKTIHKNKINYVHI